MDIPPRPASGPTIVLCGPMGSGKTSVGLVLAQRWDRRMRDTDDDVETTSGRTIGDIFLQDGEPHFRELEAAAVATALAEHDGVLALGGGSVLHPGSQQRLAEYVRGGGIVVFLDVSIEYAAPRVGLDDSRPLLMGNPVQRWKDIFAVRRPTYDEVSSLRVLTDGVTPEEVAVEVERRLRVGGVPLHESPHGMHHPS